MTDLEFWKDLGNIFDAILTYQKKNVEFNNRFINPWIRLGNIFDKDDQNKQAVMALQHAIEIDPDNAQKWTDFGDALFKINAHDEAIAAYEKAFQLDPLAGWPLCNHALTLTTQGKVQDALPLYLASIELFQDDKDKAVAWNRLGNAFRKLNDYESAFQAFQRADQLDSENTGFRDQLDEPTEENSETVSVIAPEEVLDQISKEQPATVLEQINTVDEKQPIPVDDQTTLAEKPVAIVESFTETPIEEAAPVLDFDETIEAAQSPAEEIIEEQPVMDVNIPTMGIEEAVETTQTLTTELVVDEQVLSEDAAPVQVAEEIVETVQIVTVVIAEEQTSDKEEIPAPGAEELVNVVMETNAAQDESIFSTTTLSLDVVQTFTELPVQAEKNDVEPDQSENNAEVFADQLQDQDETDESVAPDVEPASDLPQDPDDIHPFDILTNEAAYEEYLKDAISVQKNLAHSMDAELPATQVSRNGEVRIEMDTKNAHVWNELGNVYLNCGACDDAVTAYGKAIELDRSFAWPYSNLALAYVQKGRLAESILLYQRSIELFELDKDKAITWNRLGNVYRRLNDYDHAIEAYQTADDLDPDSAMISLRSRFGLMGNIYSEQKSSFVA